MGTVVAANTRFAYRAPFASAIQVMWPGASWNGTVGSGGTAPAESTTIRGSGFVQRPIANFDEPPQTYLASSDKALTVVCDHADDSWIDHVEFWCEGRSTTVYQPSESPRTGALGFVCTLQDSAFSAAGTAQVYAYVRPFNGFERRIGPITVHRYTDAQRAVRYLSPTGSDSNDGLTSGTPWASCVKAQVAAPDGAIVYMAAGTYLEDSNNGTKFHNLRPIEFRRAPGVAAGAVIYSRSVRHDSYQDMRCDHVIFKGIRWDMGQIMSIWGGNTLTFDDCDLVDPAGAAGAFDTWPGIGQVQVGRRNNYDVVQTTFRDYEGQFVSLLGSRFDAVMSTGLSLIRDSTLQVAGDVNFIDNGITVINSSAAAAPQNLHGRLHLADTVTVASVSYAAGVQNDMDGHSVPGLTTITWNETTSYNAVSSPGIPLQNCQFLSGSLAGQEFNVRSQTTGGIIVLYGDCRAISVGDSARAYGVWHTDTIQTPNQAETNPISVPTNIIFQRYRSTGPLQVLWQCGQYTGQGTVTTSGDTVTCSSDHRLAVNDVVWVAGGPAVGQSRVVVEVTSTTTARMDSAWDTSQTGVAWKHGKGIRDVLLQGCRIEKTSSLAVLHQWQNGMTHAIIRQCTLLGQTLSFSPPDNGMAMVDCLITDSIIESQAPAIFGTTWPVNGRGVRFINNHFLSGASIGTATVAAATFDAERRPLTGVTRTVSNPRISRNVLGEPVVSGAHVGALG